MTFRRHAIAGLAAAALALTAACTATETRESAGEYVDSSLVSNKIRAAIIAEKGLSIFAIDVTTFRGQVQLSGFVDTATQKRLAETVTRKVPGVREIRNNLVVKTR